MIHYGKEDFKRIAKSQHNPEGDQIWQYSICYITSTNECKE